MRWLAFVVFVIACVHVTVNERRYDRTPESEPDLPWFIPPEPEPEPELPSPDAGARFRGDGAAPASLGDLGPAHVAVGAG